MSKKLIATAAAIALAITGLAVAPANASVALTLVAVSTSTASAADAGAGTAASPYTEKVPAANIITDATSFSVTTATLAAGTTVTVETTGPVRVVDKLTGATADALYNVASGLTTWNKTTTASETVVFHVFTTSTVAGTFRVSTKTATSSAVGDLVHVKGIPGSLYNVTPTVPATVTPAAAGEITVVAKDVFGNVIENSSAVSTALDAGDQTSVIGFGDTTAKTAVLGGYTWDADRKVYKTSVTVNSTNAFSYVLSVPDIDDVSGLAKASVKSIHVVNGTSAAAVNEQVATLTAQIATMRPKATSVTKKRFNTLARKWNAAFPSQKVALKK